LADADLSFLGSIDEAIFLNSLFDFHKWWIKQILNTLTSIRFLDDGEHAFGHLKC